MRKLGWPLLVACAAVLGACRSSDVKTVVGDEPAEVAPGFHAAGMEVWQVTGVEPDGNVRLERVDDDDEAADIQRTSGREETLLVLDGKTIEKKGGIGIRKATLRPGDRLSIIRTADGEIQTIELETTRDAN